jgi:hypothetical protein
MSLNWSEIFEKRPDRKASTSKRKPRYPSAKHGAD